MDYSNLLKRLHAAKQHNAGKVAIQLRIRTDELDSLISSIRSLVNLNDQYRHRVQGLQATIDDLQAQRHRQDEELAEKSSMVYQLRGQIIQHELRIRQLEKELDDEWGDDEMNGWYQRLRAEQSAKQAMRGRV